MIQCYNDTAMVMMMMMIIQCYNDTAVIMMMIIIQ